MDLTSVQIFKLLPRTDCGECGFSTCKSFAAKVATEQAKLDTCPYFSYEELSSEDLTRGQISSLKRLYPTNIKRTNEQKSDPTLIDKYREDYEKALNSIEIDVKKMIDDGRDMQGLTLLSENIGRILEIHDSLDNFYKIIFTWQEALKHFKSERIRQLGHDLVMLRSKMKEISNSQPEVHEAVVMDNLNKLGFNRKHWLLKPCLLNETEYLLEVLQILIEPEFIPLGQVSEETNETQKPDRYIPSNVKIAIWRRDVGKCVDCGPQEKLEYDHIIPVSKGGSNTERNIQLLCEKCNRKKSATIQ
jgi:hypothetical protein